MPTRGLTLCINTTLRHSGSVNKACLEHFDLFAVIQGVTNPLKDEATVMNQLPTSRYYRNKPDITVAKGQRPPPDTVQTKQ